MDEEAQDEISRYRGPTFNKIEVKTLINLIDNHKRIILNKSTNSKVNHAKEVAWVKIAKIFNDQGFEHERTAEKLKMKWENMKREARKLSKNLIDVEYNEYNYLTSKVVGMLNENEKCNNNIELPDVEQELSDSIVAEKETKYLENDNNEYDQSVDDDGDTVRFCRSLNFSPQECSLLLKCVRDEKNYILSKEINGRAIKLKNNAWSRVTHSFNKSSPEKRSTKVLRTKFNNMKKFVKNMKMANYSKNNNEHKRLVEENDIGIKSEPMYECEDELESDSMNSDNEVENTVDVVDPRYKLPGNPNVVLPDPLSTVLNSDSGIGGSMSSFGPWNTSHDKEVVKLKLELLKYQLETAKLERQRLHEAMKADAAEREAKAMESSLRLRAARLAVAAAELKLPAAHPASARGPDTKRQFYSEET